MPSFVISYTETRTYTDEVRIEADTEAEALARFHEMATANELEPDVLEETHTDVDGVETEEVR